MPHGDALVPLFVTTSQLLLMQHAKESHLKLFEDIIGNGDLIVDACCR
jgi:hypothetical protein